MRVTLTWRSLTDTFTYTIDDLGTPITGLPGNETDRVGIHPLGTLDKHGLMRGSVMNPKRVSVQTGLLE